MSRESGPKYTPQKMAEIEKSRALSDAGLLRKGAKFEVNKKGEKTLEPTEKQIEKIAKQDPEVLKERKNVVKENFLEKLENKEHVNKIPKELQNNREVVLAVVRQRGYLLTDASERLKNDREIVLEAIKHYAHLSDIPYKMRADREIVSIALKNDPSNFKSVPEELVKDKKFMLEIIKQDPRFPLKIAYLLDFPDSWGFDIRTDDMHYLYKLVKEQRDKEKRRREAASRKWRYGS